MARAKLGEILVQRGVIDAATLKRALGEQVRFAAQKFKLGQILVDMKACTWADVASALSHQQSVPFTDLANPDENAVRLLAPDLCEKHRAVAFGREVGPPDVVKVAFADPSDLAAVDAVRFRLGKPLRASIAAPDAIQNVIDRVLKGVQSSAGGAIELDSELFGDASDAISVDHFEQGDLQVPGFAPAHAPMPELIPEEPSMGISLSTEATFDSLFGDTPAASPRPMTPPPLQAEPELEPTLDATPIPVIEPEPLVSTTPRAAVTVFPDHRKREAPPPPPAQTAPPTKPTLVLTSDALFAGAAHAPPPPPPEEVLLSGDGVDMVEEDAPPESPSSAAPQKEALFDSSFHAGDHPDPMHPVHTAEPGAAAELFGESFEAGPHTGELQIDLAQLPSEEPASTPASDVELDDPDELGALEAALEEQPVAARPSPPEPEVLPEPEIDDALLDEPTDAMPVPQPAPAEPPKPAAAATAPAEPPAPTGAPAEPEGLAAFADRPLTAAELSVIGVIEQLADGAIEDAPIKQAKPAHMIAALVRLLIRQGVIRETEFLEELTRK